MNAVKILENIGKKSTKVDITALTRDDFSTAQLRAKYFRANNRSLDRLHLPEMTAEVYNKIAKENFTGPRVDPKNLSFETASSYYIKKARLLVLAKDLGISPKRLDASEYLWNEDWYIHSNLWLNSVIVEDLFKERAVDERYLSAHTVYISQDPKHNAVDLNMWNRLYNFCYTAIVHRKAMLLNKVSQCVSFLLSVLEYTNGFTENCSGMHNATMKSYLTFFTELLADKEALEFIQNTNDIEVFAKNEDTLKDYVETYRTMLRRMFRCSGEELDTLKAELSKVEDPYIDLLVAKELDPEDFLSGSYIQNEEDDSEIEPDEE